MGFNTRRVLLFGLMFALVAGVVTISVFAMPEGYGMFGRVGNSGDTSAINSTNNAIRTDLINALDSTDYTAYMNALDRQWESYRAGITRDKFTQMVANYDAMKNNSMNSSRDRRMIEGIGGRFEGMGRSNNWTSANWSNTNKWNNINMTVVHDAQVQLQQALDSGDYNSWKAAVDTLNSNAPSGMPYFSNNMTEQITADNFATFVNFSKAVHDGNFTAAKQLATTLGIDGYAIPMMPLGQGISGQGMGGNARFGRGQFNRMMH